MSKAEKNKRINQMKALQNASGLDLCEFAEKMTVNVRTVYAWYSGQNTITEMALVLAGYIVRDAVSN